MSSQITENMTREEKEKFADQKAEEMKIKNEALRKRFQATEDDRRHAEEENSSVTSCTSRFEALQIENILSDDQRKQAHLEWKSEREKYDAERIARVRSNSGDYKREWDREKLELRNEGFKDNRTLRDNQWNSRQDVRIKDHRREYDSKFRSEEPRSSYRKSFYNESNRSCIFPGQQNYRQQSKPSFFKEKRNKVFNSSEREFGNRPSFSARPGSSSSQNDSCVRTYSHKRNDGNNFFANDRKYGGTRSSNVPKQKGFFQNRPYVEKKCYSNSWHERNIPSKGSSDSHIRFDKMKSASDMWPDNEVSNAPFFQKRQISDIWSDVGTQNKEDVVPTVETSGTWSDDDDIVDVKCFQKRPISSTWPGGGIQSKEDVIEKFGTGGTWSDDDDIVGVKCFQKEQISATWPGGGIQSKEDVIEKFGTSGTWSDDDDIADVKGFQKSQTSILQSSEKSLNRGDIVPSTGTIVTWSDGNLSTKPYSPNISAMNRIIHESGKSNFQAFFSKSNELCHTQEEKDYKNSKTNGSRSYASQREQFKNSQHNNDDMYFRNMLQTQVNNETNTCPERTFSEWKSVPYEKSPYDHSDHEYDELSMWDDRMFFGGGKFIESNFTETASGSMAANRNSRFRNTRQPHNSQSSYAYQKSGQKIQADATYQSSNKNAVGKYVDVNKSYDMANRPNLFEQSADYPLDSWKPSFGLITKPQGLHISQTVSQNIPTKICDRFEYSKTTPKYCEEILCGSDEGSWETYSSGDEQDDDGLCPEASLKIQSNEGQCAFHLSPILTECFPSEHPDGSEIKSECSRTGIVTSDCQQLCKVSYDVGEKSEFKYNTDLSLVETNENVQTQSETQDSVIGFYDGSDVSSAQLIVHLKNEIFLESVKREEDSTIHCSEFNPTDSGEIMLEIGKHSLHDCSIAEVKTVESAQVTSEVVEVASIDSLQTLKDPESVTLFSDETFISSLKGTDIASTTMMMNLESHTDLIDKSENKLSEHDLEETEVVAIGLSYSVETDVCSNPVVDTEVDSHVSNSSSLVQNVHGN